MRSVSNIGIRDDLQSGSFLSFEVRFVDVCFCKFDVFESLAKKNLSLSKKNWARWVFSLKCFKFSSNSRTQDGVSAS